MLEKLDFFICENFDDINDLIKLRREKMKLDIDKTSDQLIDCVNQAEWQCKIATNKMTRINTQLEQANTTLKLLLVDLYSLEKNNAKFDRINC